MLSSEQMRFKYVYIELWRVTTYNVYNFINKNALPFNV